MKRSGKFGYSVAPPPLDGGCCAALEIFKVWGLGETAVVQISSLQFIMSDGRGVKKKLNTFLREQWSCLITQLGNQLGAY